MNKEKQNKIIAIVGLVLSIGALTLGFVFVFIGYFTWTPLDFNIFLIGLIMCIGSFVIAIILLVQWKELEISKFFIAFVIIIVACIAIFILTMSFLGLYAFLDAIFRASRNL